MRWFLHRARFAQHCTEANKERNFIENLVLLAAAVMATSWCAARVTIWFSKGGHHDVGTSSPACWIVCACLAVQFRLAATTFFGGFVRHVLSFAATNAYQPAVSLVGGIIFFCTVSPRRYTQSAIQCVGLAFAGHAVNSSICGGRAETSFPTRYIAHTMFRSVNTLLRY